MLKTYDVAVLGATAAGYVSALALARKGHAVIVLDAPGSPTESPLADWLPADVLRACPLLRQVRSAGMNAPFREMRFHSAGLEEEASWRSRGTAGFLLRSGRLLRALAGAAGKAGITRRRAEQPPELDLQEAAVAIAAGKRIIRASLLLIAQDSPAEVIARLHLPVRAVPTGRLTLCGLDAPVPRNGQRRGGGALHVVAFGKGERLGMFFVVGGVLHVRILSAQAQYPADAAALGELIRKLREARMLPEKLRLGRSSAALWRPPGGVALELETHLAKRTLLVGTAGGFASAMTGQTLDPSIRSALVAADVAGRALRAKQPQDVLADYKNQWRNALADRIRPTGTSIQMLMPMVLSNAAMTRRFTRAFLCGERI